MKEFLNTLMLNNWVDYGDFRTRVGAGLLKSLAYNEEGSEIDVKPVPLTRSMIESNGWKLLSTLDSLEDVYGKKVQEGRDNSTYSISIHVSNSKDREGKVVQVWVFKDYPQKAKNYKECVAALNHRLDHEDIYVHTFQNLLNIVGLKDTSEEFNIM